MTSDKKGNEMLPLALRLMLIVATVVLLLSAVNFLTAGTIAEREAEKSRQARAVLIEDAEDFEKIDFSMTEEEAKTVTGVYRAFAGDKTLGYCFDVNATGFGSDAICMIVAVSADGNLYGIQVISNAETPGIGAAALEADGGLLSQYAGLSVLSAENTVPVSGATITSKGVSAAVKTAVDIFNRITQEGGVK